MLDIPFLKEEHTPVPPAILKIAVILCGLVPIVLAYRSETPPSMMSAVVTAVAAILVFTGWRLSFAQAGDEPRSKKWLLLVGAGALGACASLFLQQSFNAVNFLWALLLPTLVIMNQAMLRNSSLCRHVMIPLMFGAIFMFTAGSLGVPTLGAFPAVIGALFIAVVRATIEIEEDLFENHADSKHMEVEQHYRHRLAITAVIFFLFGTVSLWPWLGDMYGKGYFWLLLVGVLLPLAFFWGRIRQPKLEGAKTALIRFNRIAPVLGLIHVLAFIAS